MSATVKTAELKDALSRFALKSFVRINAMAVVTVEDSTLVFTSPKLTCRVPFEGRLSGTVKLNARMLSRLAPVLPKTEALPVGLGNGFLTIGELTLTKDSA